MTRKTGESRIALAPATAALQAIGGETRIVHSAIWQLTDVPPRAVTGAAEINRGAGIEVTRIHNHSGIFSARAGCSDVRSARPMAAFARDARHGMGGIEMVAYVHSRHVTAKARRRFFFGDLAAHRIFHGTGNSGRMVRGDGNSQTAKKTDTCLFKISIVLEQKALAPATASKYPKYGSRKRLVVSRNRICDGAIVFVQAVMERPNVISCLPARELRFRGGNRGMRHSVLLLARSQSGMALGADFRAYVICPRSFTLTRPPPRFCQVFLAGELLADGGGRLRRGHGD